MSKFYVVATPIGNLEDMTLRAIGVLSSVDLILCEDTRMTARLLEKYQIMTPTVSYPADSSKTKKENPKINKVLEFLKEGKNVALVSDAGTPGISDPGSLLVSKIRAELPAVEIFAVPGASALTAAISIAGVPSSDFLFLGFLPHKKGRETLFKEISESKRAVVFYESPHRILKTLQSLKEHLASDRKISIARELTKIYEEVVGGTPEAVLSYFETNKEKVRGEFVVIVSA